MEIKKYKHQVRNKPNKYSMEIIDKIITLINENVQTKDISERLWIPKPIINYYRLKQKWHTRKKST